MSSTIVYKKQTAHDAYLDKHMELMHNIKRLQAYVETHAMKEPINQRNWGYAGDIDYINDLVLRAMGDVQ